MVPVIDFRSKNVEKQMYDAYTTVGFAVFTNVFNSFISEFEDWFQVAQEFFDLPLEIRRKYPYAYTDPRATYEDYCGPGNPDTSSNR